MQCWFEQSTAITLTSLFGPSPSFLLELLSRTESRIFSWLRYSEVVSLEKLLAKTSLHQQRYSRLIGLICHCRVYNEPSSSEIYKRKSFSVESKCADNPQLCELNDAECIEVIGSLIFSERNYFTVLC